jgi:hypothetical protein
VGPLSDPINHFGRYHYANNNPYKYTDPDGRTGLDWGERCRATQQLAVDLGGTPQDGIDAIAEGQAIGAAAAVAIAVPDPTGAAVLRASGRQVVRAVAKEESKRLNGPPDPLPEAEGRPHTRLERPSPDGQYTTHNDDGTYKQYRGSGQDDGGIPRPNVKETRLNTAPDGKQYPSKPEVRPARTDEIPRGG